MARTESKAIRTPPNQSRRPRVQDREDGGSAARSHCAHRQFRDLQSGIREGVVRVPERTFGNAQWGAHYSDIERVIVGTRGPRFNRSRRRRRDLVRGALSCVVARGGRILHGVCDGDGARGIGSAQSLVVNGEKDPVRITRSPRRPGRAGCLAL